MKLGPGTNAAALKELLHLIDPTHVPGRVTLITRFGSGSIRECLPALIHAAKRAGHTVLWSCDPMHGYTVKTGGGLKTRHFEAVLSELRQAFEIHVAEGSQLGGVHFELTGEAVTECMGGNVGVSESDLPRAYETGCDPRLNGAQSLEMAFLIAGMLRQ